MKTIDITNLNNIVLDEDTILSGTSSSLTIILPKFKEVKLVLNDTYITNLEVKLEEGSILKCDSYEFSSKKTNRHFVVEKNANLSLKNISAYALDAFVNIDLNGEGASVVNNVLLMTKEEANYNTSVMHNDKHTSSKVSNYGISLDNGGITYKTTGKINRGFSSSSCEQLSRGIIAGDKAYVKALPILLIDEYDVKANHGASIGKMSDDELFYLMSRGLTKQEAFKLILSGIINPFLESLLDENFRDKISESIYRLL